MTQENQSSEKPTVRTTVSVPREDYSELEVLAERKKVSVAWVVREAIDRYLHSEMPLFRYRDDDSKGD